ncbi:hypothetical protein [Aeropyrum pernix]|uniref:hypothetical protein n=1 Tax=Aeropyrum pernix TaxID=56636 RepID=UPI001037C157|nr:hypothetical protein [Aeropyrum pernix]
MGCKRSVELSILDHSSGIRRVIEASLHPKGCMGASQTHLDIPEDALDGTLLGAIALSRGARLRIMVVNGCFRIVYQPLPPVDLCIGSVEAKPGLGYIKRRDRGKIYLSLPGL